MKTLCVGCGVLLFAAVGFAQVPDPFDFHVADFRLLTSKQIQAEIGITPAERAMLNKYSAAHDASVLALEQQVARQGKDPSKIRADDPAAMKLLVTLRDKVLRYITPHQLRRLRELSLQSVDMGGVLDSAVSKRIGMTDAQLKKARDIYGSSVQRSRTITQGVEQQVVAPYRNLRPKTKEEANTLNQRINSEMREALKKRLPELKAVEAQTKKGIQAVLTAKQLAAYKALQGKTFTPKPAK